MKKYYIHNGKNQEGPLTIEELADKGITAKTMVWYNGLAEWVEAQTIPELKDIIALAPPPFSGNNTFKKTIEKTKEVLDTDYVEEIENKITSGNGKKIFKWSVFVLTIIGLIVVIVYLLNKTPLKITNQNKPTDSLILIEPTGTAHYSSYSKDWNLKVFGEIFNRANNYAYKDIKIEVDFLTNTNTFLEKREYILFELINPKTKVNIAHEIEVPQPPAGCEKLNWRILGATPLITNKSYKIFGTGSSY